MEKKELLKMSKEEILENYKVLEKTKENINCFRCINCLGCLWCYDCSACSHCYDCSRCYDCSVCSDCFDCFGCNNIKDKQYMILNIQLAKEEYEKKMKGI